MGRGYLAGIPEEGGLNCEREEKYDESCLQCIEVFRKLQGSRAPEGDMMSVRGCWSEEDEVRSGEWRVESGGSSGGDWTGGGTQLLCQSCRDNPTGRD